MLAGGVYMRLSSGGKDGGGGGGDDQGRSTALLVLGSLCFVPGAYHTRVAWLAWRGVEGYSLSAIPDL